MKTKSENTLKDVKKIPYFVWEIDLTCCKYVGNLSIQDVGSSVYRSTIMSTITIETVLLFF